MKHSTVVAGLLIAVGVAGLGTYAFSSSVSAARAPIAQTTVGYDTVSFGGMMGWGSIMGGYVSNQTSALTTTAANKAMKSSLSHAMVDRARNAITYKGKTIDIVVFAGAMDDSKTGPAEKFVVGGLVNPTLHVSANANVTLRLVNEDTDMPHGMEISASGPPYGYMSMMQGGIYPGSVIAPISEASENHDRVAVTHFNASQTGTFYYLCQYPGHASEGMYGKLVIS